MKTTLTIAGVEFIISSSLDLFYPAEAGPYTSFSGAVSSDVCVDVTIGNGAFPSFADMDPVAEADDAWKMYADGAERWIVCADGVSWAAGISPDGRHVRILCPEGGNQAGRIPSPFMYPIDQLVLIHLLSDMMGVLVHGVGVFDERAGRGMLLAGVSGAGKTTLACLADKSDGLVVLSDDRIVVRELDGKMMMYGTPWPGEGGFAFNRAVPLDSICFLKKGATNDVVPLSAASAVERLLPVSSVPWYDRERASMAMSVIEAAVSKCAGYDFIFKPDRAAVEMLRGLSERSSLCTAAV